MKEYKNFDLCENNIVLLFNIIPFTLTNLCYTIIYAFFIYLLKIGIPGHFEHKSLKAIAII